MRYFVASLLVLLLLGVINLAKEYITCTYLSGLSKEKSELTKEEFPLTSTNCRHFNGSGCHQLTLKLKGKTALKQITEVNQNSFKDLKDEIHEHESEYRNVSFEEALRGREKIWDILVEAGIQQIDVPTLMTLPTWEEVTTSYGDGPIIHGLDTCERFRSSVPNNDAFVGVAGIYNTGTNALALYMKGNLQMPNNPQMGGGILTTVPWHKHWFPSYRWNYTEKLYLQPSWGGEMIGFHSNRSHILPIVMIRDPYTWIQSMCSASYDFKWNHNKKHCPNFPNQWDKDKNQHDDNVNYLRSNHQHMENNDGEEDADDTNNNRRRQLMNLWDVFNVGKDKDKVRWPKLNADRSWESIIHLYNEWYNEYIYADFPRLIIRFEDLLFHAKEVMDTIRECAGAKFIDEDSFAYVVDHSKYGHKIKYQTNMVSAMIKHTTRSRRYRGMTENDMEYTREHIDPQLMKLFSYGIE